MAEIQRKVQDAIQNLVEDLDKSQLRKKQVSAVGKDGTKVEHFLQYLIANLFFSIT